MSLLTPISQNRIGLHSASEAIVPRFFHLMSRPQRISYLVFRKKEESLKVNESAIANKFVNKKKYEKFLSLEKQLTKEIKVCQFIANKEKRWRLRVIAGDGHCLFRAFLGGFLDKLNRLASREAREAFLAPIGEQSSPWYDLHAYMGWLSDLELALTSLRKILYTVDVRIYL